MSYTIVAHFDKLCSSTALQGPQGLLTLFSTCAELSQSQTKPSSENVEEEATLLGLMVSNARPFSQMQSLVTTHQGVTCASLSPTMQVSTQLAGGGSGPPRELDAAAVKGE